MICYRENLEYIFDQDQEEDISHSRPIKAKRMCYPGDIELPSTMEEANLKIKVSLKVGLSKYHNVPIIELISFIVIRSLFRKRTYNCNRQETKKT